MEALKTNKSNCRKSLNVRFSGHEIIIKPPKDSRKLWAIVDLEDLFTPVEYVSFSCVIEYLGELCKECTN